MCILKKIFSDEQKKAAIFENVFGILLITLQSITVPNSMAKAWSYQECAHPRDMETQ